MASSRKKHTPPDSEAMDVTIPKALEPLVKAFNTDSEEVVNALVVEAVKALIGSDKVSTVELDGITSLMEGLSPQSPNEVIYAAQAVACHVIGIHKLSANYGEDQKLGLKFLRFSNEVFEQLYSRKK